MKLDLSFDTNRTKALLIGINDYRHLPSIKPSTNNIHDLFKLFSNHEIMGIPKDNMVSIIDKNHQEIFEDFLDFLESSENQEIDTVIVYYVGHGVRDILTKELYLTGVNSKSNSIRISGVPFSEMKNKLDLSSIQKKIIILDCCHSGLAAMDSREDFLTDVETEINGSFVLTSSAGFEKSFFDPNSRNTFFTEQLVNILNKGLPIDQPFLTLENIFKQLSASLKHSTPQRKMNMNISEFFFCHNLYFIYKHLEKKADKLFEDTEFENAKKVYEKIYIKISEEYIKDKIKLCEENIELLNSLSNEFSSSHNSKKNKVNSDYVNHKTYQNLSDLYYAITIAVSSILTLLIYFHITKTFILSIIFLSTLVAIFVNFLTFWLINQLNLFFNFNKQIKWFLMFLLFWAILSDLFRFHPFKLN